MASIPLPALDIHPQPQQDPAAGIKNAFALRNAQNEGQIQQQQIQAGSQENQLRQMQLQDMQTIQKIAPQYVTKDASGKPTGYDYDGLTNGAIAAGVRPQSLAQLQTMRKNAADTLLAQSGADKNAIENQEKLNKQGFEQIEAIKALSDPQQRQSAWENTLRWGQQNKVDVSKFPTQAPNNDALTGFEPMFGMHAQALSDAKEAAQTKEASSRAEEAASNTAKNLKVAAGMTPTGITAEQQAQLAQGKQRLGVEAGRLTVEQGRLAIEKQKVGPIPLEQITNTTKAGRQYISAEDIPKETVSAVRQQAAAAGIPVVNKDTAGILSDIDNAKTNQDFMLQTIEKKLASGAPTRLWYGPANTIEKMAQTDPEMGAVGTFRSAAIQSMRAVAGSKGLRINQAEIQMAIDNDIPKLTDTLPVAQAKLKNMEQFLENTEASHLVRNRQQNSPQTVPTGGPSLSVKAPNGKTYNFKDQAAADAFRKEAGIQ